MAPSDEHHDDKSDTSGSWLRTGGAWDEDLGRRLDSEFGEDPLRPGQRIGTLRIDGTLGTGGMGTVYLGFDERLERQVAVKTLHMSPRLGAEARRRFEREAKALSRLNHPNICQIYSLVEAESSSGRPLQCLVLEKVEGQTLGQALKDLDLEGKPEIKLEIHEQIARGLAVAHAEGIVHRDLKPDNVMLTPAGEVKILDFGIARMGADADPPGSSDPRPAATDGTQLIGTPRYMSPEQALGEPLTPASDVYSLGLLLFEAVGGRPAHPDDSTPLELLRRAAEAEVETLDGDVDQELAALVAELLDRNPAARPTADECADRLRWILDRPLRVRRRRVTLTLAAVVLLALGAAAWSGVDAWRTRRDAELQSVAARRLGEEVRSAESLLRISRLAPPHDVGLARNQVTERLRRMSEEFADAGAWAEGPLAYARGRILLALGDAEGARDALTFGWSRGYRGAEVAEALGLALGRLYDDAIQEALRRPTEDQRRAALAKADAELRRPAVEWLSRSRSLASGRPASADLITARIALYQEQFADAVEAADAVIEAEPWLYEALQIRSLAHRGEARADVAEGRSSDVLEHLGEAASDLDRALAVARSDAALHLDRCRLAEEIINRTYGAGVDFEPAYERALAACRAARRLLPGSAEPWVGEARLAYYLSWARLQDRKDPGDAIDDMDSAIRRALELAPDSAEVHRLLGLVSYQRGVWDALVGGGQVTARKHLRAALVALDRAGELAPDSPDVHYSSGLVYFELGFIGLYAGEDPRPSLRAAAAAFSEARRLAPTTTSAASMLGSSQGVMAMYALERGLDPLEHLRAAIEAFEQVLAVDPVEAAARGNLGLAYRDLATYHWRTGDFEAARAALDDGRRAMELHLTDKPDSVSALITLADLGLIRARVQGEERLDPTPALDEVDRQVELLRQLEIEGNNVLRLRSESLRLRACTTDAEGSAELLREAGEVADRWQRRGGDYLARRRLVEIASCRAELGPDDRVASRGLSLVRRLLDERPDDGEAWLLQARLLRLGDADSEAFREALRRAEEANPWLARQVAALRVAD